MGHHIHGPGPLPGRCPFRVWSASATHKHALGQRPVFGMTASNGSHSRRSSGTHMTSLCALTGTTHSRTRRAIRPQIAVGLLQSGELKFDQLGVAVSLYNRGAKGQPNCTATQPRRPASGNRRRRVAPCLQRLTTHSKNRVGMAGFEPAASCSQISFIRSPDVVWCRPVWRSPEAMHAARRLTWPSVCARWRSHFGSPGGRYIGTIEEPGGSIHPPSRRSTRPR